MIETNLNIFDCVVIGILFLSCIIAFFRGLIKEILSLVAWVGAGIITVYYFPDVAEKMQSYFKSATMAAAVSAIGLYIVSLIGFAIVNMLIIKTIKQGGETGMLDNILGLVFGAFRGAFIVSLGFFLLTVALHDQEYPKWVKESVTHPYAEKGALVLTRLAPEYVSEISSLQKKAIKQAEEHVREKREQEEEYGTGYNQKTTRQMDRLLEGSEQTR